MALTEFITLDPRTGGVFLILYAQRLSITPRLLGSIQGNMTPIYTGKPVGVMIENVGSVVPPTQLPGTALPLETKRVVDWVHLKSKTLGRPIMTLRFEGLRQHCEKPSRRHGHGP